MKEVCERYRTLISGYVDGELTAEEERELLEHLETCEACRAEYEGLKGLVAASDGLEVAAPPEEVWDTFLDGVYNRLERRTGWVVFTVGVAALCATGLYAYVTEPWASAAVKVVCAVPITGLLVLFVSVLRQRLFVARTDRYSREVKR